MQPIIRQFMANISYSESTFNTLLIVEYKHTGKQYYHKKSKNGARCCTTDEEIKNIWIDKGYKITENEGYYFVHRVAIPTRKPNGKKDIWYINNPGDYYRINKISKYGKKVMLQMSQPQPPIN